MRPMMPPPAGMRGPMRIGPGPRGYLTDEEKREKPKVTKALLKRILSYFKKEEIDTIKALIKCNGNSFKAANELYLHRNSFNYRINKLQSRLNLSLRDLNTLIFLNLVFALF